MLSVRLLVTFQESWKKKPDTLAHQIVVSMMSRRVALSGTASSIDASAPPVVPNCEGLAVCASTKPTDVT
jgi:hypothetical protein